MLISSSNFSSQSQSENYQSNQFDVLMQEKHYLEMEIPNLYAEIENKKNRLKEIDEILDTKKIQSTQKNEQNVQVHKSPPTTKKKSFQFI